MQGFTVVYILSPATKLHVVSRGWINNIPNRIMVSVDTVSDVKVTLCLVG